MPTYEYACKNCGEHLEVVQSFRDDPLTECPACHGQLRKVFSAAGLIFKGSGWHIKDYSSSSKPADSSTDSGSRQGGRSAASSGDSSSGDSSSGDSSSGHSSSKDSSPSKPQTSSSSGEAKSA